MEVADLTPKGPSTQSAPEGGRKFMTMVIMMMMMMMIMMMATMTMVIIMCFLLPKGPQTGLAPGGANKLLSFQKSHFLNFYNFSLIPKNFF